MSNLIYRFYIILLVICSITEHVFSQINNQVGFRNSQTEGDRSNSSHLKSQICNRVLDFDGINDQVLCNTPTNGSTAFTIEFWFKSENNRQGNCDTNSLNAFNWIFSFAGDKFGLGDCKGNLKLIYSPYCQTGNYFCEAVPSFPINDNKWHHFVFGKDSVSGADMWIDGKHFFHLGKSNFFLPEVFRIGNSYTMNNGNTFRGRIDEFRIWAFRKSAIEIQNQLYCQLKGNEDSLITYYTIEQGIPEGNNSIIGTIIDYSFKLNHGLLRNFNLNGKTSNIVCSDTLRLDSSCINNNCKVNFEVQSLSCNRVKFFALPSFQPNNDSLTYHWVGINTNFNTNEKNPEYTFTSGTGKYEICLTVKSRICEAVFCQILNINIPGPPSFLSCPEKTTLYGCEAKYPINVFAFDSCTKMNILPICKRDDLKMLDEPYPIGITNVTCTAISASGDSNVCKIQIEVKDTIPPVCDLSIYTIVLNNSGTAELREDFTKNFVHDNCSPVSVSPFEISFNCTHIGVTIPAQFEMKDAFGNKRNCSFIIKVEDRTDPSCIGRDTVISASTEGGANLNFSISTFDNCTVNFQSCTPVSGSLFPCGPTIVACTVQDVSGNLGRCSFKVDVIDCNTCCKDEIQFNKLLNNDFTLESRWSQAQNCEIQLYPPNLSDCQYIGQLKWGDGTITNGKFPDTLDFIHEYLGPGKFKVCITIKEGIDSSCFLGTICSDIQINNDCKLTVDTDNPLGTNILIFPNPAHEKIQIQSQISFNRLEIYNLDGRKLMCLNETHLTNQTVIDIRSLNSGAYIIKLWNTKGDQILTKFFKL
ncbi:MAG: HYR domain-containing protein [Saprospiraceae bacterium]|nr:HYR domain-containing protein [Saprospiraceae bacterium]